MLSAYIFFSSCFPCTFAAESLQFVVAIFTYTLSADGTAIELEQNLLVGTLIRTVMIVQPEQLSRPAFRLRDEEFGFEGRFIGICDLLDRFAADVTKEGKSEGFKR